MQPPCPAPQVITPYEEQAREAAHAWSQLALSSIDPQFDIESSRQADIHGGITARHRLSVETDTTRWYGRIQCDPNDIVCTEPEAFDEAVREQGLLALYDESAQEDLKKRIEGAEYAAYRDPTSIPAGARRVLYHHQCHDCGGAGSHSCATCNGEGETRCTSCGGDGDEACYSCGGSGHEQTQHTDSHGNQVEELSNCSACSGTGKVSCGGCGGSGWESCRDCHRSGVVHCTVCNGCGSLTDVGSVVLMHTPCFQVRVDPGGPESWIHVMKFLGDTGLAGHATVTLESIQEVDGHDAYASVAWDFEYRFHLPAALLEVKTRREIFGPALDHTEWTVAGHTPQVIDCDFALFPSLAGRDYDAKRNSRWQSCLQPDFDKRMSNALAQLLYPGVHRWILDGSNRGLSVDAIFVQIRRSLDPASIQVVIDAVNRALTVSYRRRLLLHQFAAVLLTLLGAAVLTAAPAQPMRELRRQLVAITQDVIGVQLEDAVMLMVVVVLVGLVMSIYTRHTRWLNRAGGAELQTRAEQLGHLDVFSVGLCIAAMMVLTAVVWVAIVVRFS